MTAQRTQTDRPCEICSVMLSRPYIGQKYCKPCSKKEQKRYVIAYMPKVRWLLGKIRRELFERWPDPRPPGVYEVEEWGDDV